MLRKICFFLILILIFTSTAYGRKSHKKKYHAYDIFDFRFGLNYLHNKYTHKTEDQKKSVESTLLGGSFEFGIRGRVFSMYAEVMPGYNRQHVKTKSLIAQSSDEHSGFQMPVFINSRLFWLDAPRVGSYFLLGLGGVGGEYTKNDEGGTTNSTMDFAAKFGLGGDFYINRHLYASGGLNFMILQHSGGPLDNFNITLGLGYRWGD